ncbi:MAG: c-type cytochrome [Paenalcaligenes sp.]
MSNTEQLHNNQSGQQGPKFSLQQIVLVVILAVIVPIAMVVMLVNLFSVGLKAGASYNDQAHEAIAARIQPVAGFVLGPAEVVAEGPKVLKTGKEVYNSTCATCHAAAVAGAPLFGSAEAWAPFVQQGYDAMLSVALNGKGAMPARGGNANLEDIEVARAMVYMANEAGAGFDEPAAPAEDEVASE